MGFYRTFRFLGVSYFKFFSRNPGFKFFASRNSYFQKFRKKGVVRYYC